MSGQVFISYRREGGDTMAYLLWDRLLSHGYRVFYDVDSLTSGKFDERIRDQIEHSSHVLVILSKDSLERCRNEDDWVRREIAYAIDQKKILVPIFLKGFQWPEEMPGEIRDLTKYQGVEMTNLRLFPAQLDRLEKDFLGFGGPAEVASADSRTRNILLWSDLSEDDNEGLVASLQEQLSENAKDPADVRLIPLANPLDILRQERNDQAPDTIILIVTDVTKFSSDENARKRLNRYLCSFVRRGGRLICSHDTIYRRTKNIALQRLFGYKITKFNLQDTVKYRKTEECWNTGAFPSLPEEFSLEDGEISLIERIPPRAKVFFTDEQNHPLVFARKQGKGICIWLNTGESTEDPPRAIQEDNFFLLLKDCISLSF